ncbi:MAG: glucose-1-phosphate thymidylyltransferase [Candidatus Thermoplasmatota archaeon]|jgi:glucose-1-phosphate thymidylyltransferase|nr:glucose-1-phosphate thymidylyltransferase [Candidatus Thermoplasmatota archaeon]
MKGIILHGGSGTRLRPITYSDVKQLLTIAGKPTSEYALLDMLRTGIREVAIVIGNVGAEEVKRYYGDGSRWNCSIRYIYQEKPLGIAHAIGLCRNFVGDDRFVVYLGDNVMQDHLDESRKEFEEGKYDAYLMLVNVRNPEKFGVCEISDNRIISLEEKPKNPKSNLAVSGIYFLTPLVFRYIDMLKPSGRGEYEIMEALQLLLEKGGKIGYRIIRGWFKDTGTVRDFLECNRLILENLEDDSDPSMLNYSGRIHIGSNTKIDGNTKILGPCFIGDNVDIQDSYIGPYTTIGNDCRIRGTEIENSVIMDHCSIDFLDGRIIFESIIGPNCTISSGYSKTRRTSIIAGRDSRMDI